MDIIAAIIAFEAKLLGFEERHHYLSEKLEQLENRIMTLVEVQQEQLDQLNASVATLQAASAKQSEDGQLLLGLIVDLRASLATALAAGTPPTIVDLTAAIASIDSVTKQLSDETTTDDGVLNPPPPVVGTPPDLPGAVTVAPVTSLPDLNPTPGPALGNVADHPGNPAPLTPAAAVAPPPAPNPGDPTGAAGLTSTDGSVTAGTAAPKG